MSRMMRKQVYITAQQDALLKRGAKALGVTEAEVARRGSELASRAGARVTPDRAPWRARKPASHLIPTGAGGSIGVVLQVLP
jgi:hypothetical protein